jgi:hypothetical protein
MKLTPYRPLFALLTTSAALASDPSQVTVESLDPAYFPDRLQFSWIENPRSTPTSADAPRDFKESGTARIHNRGKEPIVIKDAKLEGPFKLADSAAVIGRTVGAGKTLDVIVCFARDLYQPPGENTASGVFTGTLQVITEPPAAQPLTVKLAGFWQAQDENNWEPNINEVWQVFGFGNFIPGVPLEYHGPNNPLNKDSLYESCHETEVLSPYWRIAAGHGSAKITQIAAFHGPGGATVGIHAPGDKSDATDEIFWNHRGDQNQSLLPVIDDQNTFATRVFDRAAIPASWTGDGIFGIESADFSTDPKLNPGGKTPAGQRGHLTRLFKALGPDGKVIPNVYLGTQDYSGVNYDYNDNMFIIEGIEPVGEGPAAGK